MSKLKISTSLSLPVDAVTQKFGILGRTGSGKSYGATKLCEEMLDAKAQIVALDPVGVWWGLRVGADGKSPAYSIPVFGGMHGDIPLEPTGGALIADIIVDYGTSAIIDLSNFLLAEQRKFATDFATQIFHRKKSQRSPIHIFFEEAQEFVPQHVRGDVAKMVGAFERLIKLGRNFGIGATLISQRPQSVNKDVLHQTECLMAFQMTGPHERKTIESWIAEKGVDEDIASVLPHLKVGQCHIWSPQWLQISETIKIDKKKTADVSSTPQHGGAKKIEPKELSSADLEKLQEKMSATIERAKKEDPKELRKEVAELKRTIAMQQQMVDKRATQDMRKIKEVPVLKDSQLTRLEKFLDKFALLRAREIEFANEFPGKLSIEFGKVADAIARTKQSGPILHTNTSTRAVAAAPAAVVRSTPESRSGEEEKPRPGQLEDAAGLSSGARRIAAAIAQRGERGASGEQLTLLVGLKKTSRNEYVRKLKAAGYITIDRGRFFITVTGLDWLGNDYEPLPTGAALIDYWTNKLPGAQADIFKLVVANPDGVSGDDIEAQVGLKKTSRNEYLRKLKANELVMSDHGLWKPNPELFEVA